jgi:hypothetical protein
VGNLPAAINASIYLMVSMPYIAIGVVGFLIVRGCRKNAEYRETQQKSTAEGAEDAEQTE